MKRVVRLLLVAILAVTLCAIGSTKGMAAKAKVILKLAHADSIDIKTSRKQSMCVTFANYVNSKSSGRLEVQIFGGGTLGGEREFLESVKTGAVQAGIASGPIANFYPNAMITDIPYLFSSPEVAIKVMDGPFGKKLAAGFLQTTGMRCLAFGEVGFRHFTSSKRPIHSPNDLQGLKIRVMETPLYLTLIKSMGGSPTPVAWTETYSALQTGVVDGQENPIGSIVSAKLYEVQKYVTIDGHVYGVDWFVINNKFFKSLAPKLQKLLLEGAKAAVNEERRFVRQMDVDGIKILKDNKVEVYTPTTAELANFRNASQQPCIDWMKTKVDRKLVGEALKAVKAAEKAK
jgi:tripartite ATP-independent transporter DctP family solute receptor